MSQGETNVKVSLPSWLKGGLLGGVIVSVVGVAAFLLFIREPQPVPVPPAPEPDKANPIVIPAVVNVQPGDWTDLKPKVLPNHAVTWIHAPLRGLKTKEAGDALVLLGCHEGEFWIAAVTSVDGKVSSPAWVKVIVGKPKPPEPLPPGPKPPTPPDPPTPPIPEPGFRVMVIEETAKRSELPSGQAVIFGAAAVRDYLTAKAGPAGWLFVDQDADATEMPKWVQDTLKRPRASLPWIVISDGKTGFEGPLPVNVAETMALLKKWGG